MSVHTKLQVLVADDECDVLNMVATNLSGAGFLVIKAQDGAEALERARRFTPALIILDMMMPQLSGTEVLRALKSDERTAAIPVLMLTARKDEIDRVLAFELGADDYVTKPFSPRELTLRVKIILSRREELTGGKMLSAGALSIDRERHLVLVDGDPVDVTAMEFRLLSLLMQRSGRVLTRDELMANIWGIETTIDSRTIDTHLRRLREKLGAVADQIQTVRGIGYRLSAAN